MCRFESCLFRMANINDYIFLVKEIKKVVDNLQVFIGPNISQDFKDIKDHINGIKHNIELVKHNIRQKKILKHKKKIRKSHIKELSLRND